MKLPNLNQAKGRMSDLLADAIEFAPVPVLITNREAVIIYVNKKFIELSGYERQELIGQSPRILSAKKTSVSVYKELWTTIIGGNVWTGELCNKRKNGGRLLGTYFHRTDPRRK